MINFHDAANVPLQGSGVRIVAALLLGACLAAGTGCATLPRDGKLSWNAPAASVDAQGLVTHHANLTVQAAELAEQKGKSDEAIRLYEQARAMDLQWNPLCRRLAVLYDQRGDDAKAQTAYDQALAIQPNDADLLNDVGAFHLHRERWAHAETWFRRALAIQPHHERAAVNLGMSVAMQGRLSESYDLFSRLVGPAAANSNLGVLLARQGRFDEAREHLLHAKAMDHRLQPTGEFLARIDQRSVTPALEK